MMVERGVRAGDERGEDIEVKERGIGILEGRGGLGVTARGV